MEMVTVATLTTTLKTTDKIVTKEWLKLCWIHVAPRNSATAGLHRGDINMHFTRNTESHRKLSYVYLGYVENV